MVHVSYPAKGTLLMLRLSEKCMDDAQLFSIVIYFLMGRKKQ